jgi:type VI secretion system secreted protein Hcp
MAIYMKVPYASGSVTATKYQGWIEVDSLQLGVDRSVAMETGSLKARASGVPRFTEFTITKYTEDSSPGILSELMTGTSGHTVEIAVVEVGDAPKEVVKYILTDAIVSSYSVSASGESPHERLAFSYSAIEMAFTPRDKINKGAGAVRVSYDLKAAAGG